MLLYIFVIIATRIFISKKNENEIFIGALTCSPFNVCHNNIEGTIHEFRPFSILRRIPPIILDQNLHPNLRFSCQNFIMKRLVCKAQPYSCLRDFPNRIP